MSYDIYFRDKDGNAIDLPFAPPIGGTYCASSDFRKAWLNITYNYCEIYQNHNLAIGKHRDDPEGTATLEGMTAGDVVQALVKVIPDLKDDVSADYWKPTEGNAKKALLNLLCIAVAVPPESICVVW